MWCKVKNCFHNENGYCQTKDYISIDADGRCDSIHEVEALPEEIVEDEEED